jgi:hypothetical protein
LGEPDGQKLKPRQFEFSCKFTRTREFVNAGERERERERGAKGMEEGREGTGRHGGGGGGEGKRKQKVGVGTHGIPMTQLILVAPCLLRIGCGRLRVQEQWRKL